MKSTLITFNKAIVYLMVMFTPVLLITSCDKDDPVPDPSTVIANFSSQVDADNSLTYNFTNSSVVNGITDRSFTSSWDFGGDGSSSDENPSHTFSAEGTYEVTLTVTATDGVSASKSETIEVTAPKNRYASITDTRDDDTGELRLAPMDSIRNGRVTFKYRVFENAKDGFINVSGTSTSGDDAIVEVRIKDDVKHEFREGASDDAIANANFPEGVINEWVDVEISWAADGTNTPTFTVIMGGQTVIENAVSTTNGGPGDVDGHIEATKNGAFNFQWKYNSNSSTDDGTFHIDDIVIYSSDSGSEVVAFSDDFQARAAGDDLDSEVNPDSPYHPNTSEATVGEDQ